MRAQRAILPPLQSGERPHRQQAALTAQKQEVSKALGEIINESRKMMTFLDTGLRLHYGNRSERLVAFGQQPFRSQPRVRIVGPDGRPIE